MSMNMNEVEYVADEFRVINNALAQNWVKLKMQDGLYQAKLTTIAPQTPTLALNSAQTFSMEPHAY